MEGLLPSVDMPFGSLRFLLGLIRLKRIYNF
jgi:hypothetical protein